MSLVIGIEARMGGRSGPEENHQCLVQQCSREAITVSSGNAGLIPSDRGREAASTGSREVSSTDKTHQNLGSQCPQFTRVFPHISISTFRILLLPNQCLTLTIDILERLGVQLTL